MYDILIWMRYYPFQNIKNIYILFIYNKIRIRISAEIFLVLTKNIWSKPKISQQKSWEQHILSNIYTYKVYFLEEILAHGFHECTFLPDWNFSHRWSEGSRLFDQWDSLAVSHCSGVWRISRGLLIGALWCLEALASRVVVRLIAVEIPNVYTRKNFYSSFWTKKKYTPNFSDNSKLRKKQVTQQVYYNSYTDI